MLECRGITKKYISKTAVNRISMNIEPGHIYAILGPNGSGKSTLMKMIAGLIKPTSGIVLYDGKEVGVESKKKIAYMPTEPFYYNFMSIKDVGKYYNDFYGDFDLNKYYMLLDRMDLNETDKAKNLSSGLAAKLKIAATLSRKAEVYMLDEPLNGIDIIARDHIVDTIVESMDENVSMLVSSHLVDELEKIIDYAMFFKNGELILQGDAEQLRSERSMSIVELYKDIYR